MEMQIKWDGPRIKKNCLPVDGTFTHPIAGQLKVLVNPKDRRVSLITTYGALYDTFVYSQNGKAITTKRLAVMLEGRGVTQV